MKRTRVRVVAVVSWQSWTSQSLYVLTEEDYAPTPKRVARVHICDDDDDDGEEVKLKWLLVVINTTVKAIEI